MIQKDFLLLILPVTLFSFLFTIEGRSQQLTKIKEWNAGEIVNVSVDRIGNFFLLPKKGGVKKYDPNGKVMASLAKRKPTLIEPWYHPSIFIYDRGTQKYFSFGRFFEDVKEYTLAPELAIEPYLVCPTHDNRLWILDKADYSLKKINPLNHEVINEFNFDIESTTLDYNSFAQIIFGTFEIITNFRLIN